jgi:Cu/Ag efflux protein CusF
MEVLMNKLLVVCAAASLALLSNVVWSAEEGTESNIPAAGAASTVSVTATVEKVDMNSREVTLKGPEGDIVTIAVGPEVRDLEQVKVGDKVTIDYTQAVALALSPVRGGEEERGEVSALERAPEGEKPGGVLSRRVDVRATVESIDTKKREVTLKGPERTVTLAVGKDIDLSKIKVGDQVLASYSEALAVSVKPSDETKGKK